MLKTKRLFSLLILLFSALTTFGQIKSNADLSIQSDVIRNETTPKANTTARVANMFQALIDSKINVNENQYIVVSGTNSYIGSLTPAITSYFAGLKVYANFTNGNTGSSSLNLNSLGSKSITKNGSPVSAGELSGIKILVYNGTNFEVVFGLSTVTIPDGDKGDITVTSGVYNIDPTAVTYSKVQNVAALSLFGRASNTSGVGADITAALDNQVLRRSGTSIGFGPLNLSSSNAVTGLLPIASGGTGRFDLGTANQIMAVNNAGTNIEYKTLSISGAAISNDVGWFLTNSGAIELHLPSASATVRGILTSSDYNTFTNKANINSPNLTGVPTAPTAAFGNATAQIATTDFVANAVSGGVGGYTPQTRQINTTFPLSGGGDMSINRTLSIAPAVADGITLGAPGFNASHFDASGGIISLDIANIQAATSGQKGLLTSTDFTSFNSRISSLTLSLGTSGADPNASGPTSGATPTITLNIPSMSATGVNTGLINNTTQTIPGAKTLSALLTTSAGITNGGSILFNGGTGSNSTLGRMPGGGGLYVDQSSQLKVYTLQFSQDGPSANTLSAYAFGHNGSIEFSNLRAPSGYGFRVVSNPHAPTLGAIRTTMQIESALVPTTGTGGVIALGIYPQINTSGSWSGTQVGIDYSANITSGTGTAHYAALFRNGSVGIGTATPSAILHTVGTLRHDLGSDATGDLPYRTSGGNIGRLGIGSNNFIMSVVSGLPSWKDPALLPALFKTSSYVLAAGDQYSMITTNSASANTLTLNTGVFPVGTLLYITQYGAGTTTLINGAGVPAFLNSSGTLTGTRYAAITLWQPLTDVWVVFNGGPGGGGGSATWGGITGTISSQSDLMALFAGKLNKLAPALIKSASYTLISGDEDKTPTYRSASAGTLTIPANTFPVGQFINFLNDSTGTLTVGFGAGISPYSSSGTYTVAKYSYGIAFQVRSNQWIFSGSGINITNTAAANEFTISDATNLIGSGVSLTAATSTSRTVQSSGSGTNIDMILSTKGIGDMYLQGNTYNFGTDNSNTSVLLASGGATNRILSLRPKGNAVIELVVNGKSANVDGTSYTDGVRFGWANTLSIGAKGLGWQMIAGSNAAASGNGAGGDLLFRTGQRRVGGTGTDGNITIDTLTGWLIISTIPTSSSGLPSGAIWSNSNVLTRVP